MKRGLPPRNNPLRTGERAFHLYKYLSTLAAPRLIPPDEISLVSVDLPKALELLAQPKRHGRARAQPKWLRDLGKHPITDVALTMKSGRYGPDVTDRAINASLPRGADPAAITIADAVSLLEARAIRIAENGGMPRKKRRGAKKKAEKVPATKSKRRAKTPEAPAEA